MLFVISVDGGEGLSTSVNVTGVLQRKAKVRRHISEYLGNFAKIIERELEKEEKLPDYGILVETYLVEGLVAESLLEHALGPLFVGFGYSCVPLEESNFR